MTVVTRTLPDFPGFAVQYDEAKSPYFTTMVLEDLRNIARKPIGQKLLDDIAAARPTSRAASQTSNEEAKAVKFSDGINVVMVPTTMQLTQSGYRMAFTGNGFEKTLQPSSHASHRIPGCPYWPAGGSCAEAADITAAGNGTGSVSIMKYTNAQIVTSKGEAAPSFIVLAHELIHSLHHVTGKRRDIDEEPWTTGIGKYSNEPMTENAIRAAFGLELRKAYE